MAEVQKHGLVFEKWVRDTFFEKYETGYGAKWDIAKEANKKYGNLPVSIKSIKYGSSINMGDAIRQRSINEDFVLLVGFWKQEGKLKRIVNVTSTKIDRTLWNSLWEPLSLDDISELDRLIKSYGVHYSEIRKQAQLLKSKHPYCDCSITLNPKIDSKSQRRLQCSIGFNLHFSKIATGDSREAQERPTLWGVEVPEPFESRSRIFNK